MNSLSLKMCNNNNKGLKLAGFDYAIYLEKQGNLDANLVSILLQSQTDEPDAETAKQTSAKLEILKSSNVEIKKNIKKLDKNLVARIYFHIKSEKQRKRAGQIEIDLEMKSDDYNNGITVPGIELKSYELRYFNSSEKEEAVKIKLFLDGAGVQILLRDLSKKNTNSKIRPRHYEIWFGDNFN